VAAADLVVDDTDEAVSRDDNYDFAWVFIAESNKLQNN
jgi:hypothetical protein